MQPIHTHGFEAGRIHQRDLASIATKAGESFQSVTVKLSALKLGDQDGNVSFEDFLKVLSYICAHLYATTISV